MRWRCGDVNRVWSNRVSRLTVCLVHSQVTSKRTVLSEHETLKYEEWNISKYLNKKTNFPTIRNRFGMIWGPGNIDVKFYARIQYHYPGWIPFGSPERSGEADLWLFYVNLRFLNFPNPKVKPLICIKHGVQGLVFVKIESFKNIIHRLRIQACLFFKSCSFWALGPHKRQ